MSLWGNGPWFLSFKIDLAHICFNLKQWTTRLKWTPVPFCSQLEEAFIFFSSLLNILSLFKAYIYLKFEPCGTWLSIVVVLFFFSWEESKDLLRRKVWKASYLLQGFIFFQGKEFFIFLVNWRYQNTFTQMLQWLQSKTVKNIVKTTGLVQHHLKLFSKTFPSVYNIMGVVSIYWKVRNLGILDTCLK